MLLGHLPRDSATVREVHGDSVEWGATEHLLATAVDVLAAANWQRGGDKKKTRPKPLPRPGGKGEARAKAAEIRERLLAQRERLKRQGQM